MKTKTFLLNFFFIFIAVSCTSKKELKLTPSDAKGVFILKDSFAVKNLKDSLVYRKVWVYLPPNYKTSKEEFPVIYMHDGQNLFDAKTSYAGEWKVDETLNNLFNETGKGFIVVGIENTGVERLNEYSPWVHNKYGGGGGENYINMIISHLKPKIDQSFKTLTGSENTAIIGSSMGGLISYYAGLEHPDVFGKVGALSTSFWFSEEVKKFSLKKGGLQNSKLFLLVGEKEGADMVNDMFAVVKELKKAGFNSKNIVSIAVPEAQHNESFWSSEFENVVINLFNIK